MDLHSDDLESLEQKCNCQIIMSQSDLYNILKTIRDLISLHQSCLLPETEGFSFNIILLYMSQGMTKKHYDMYSAMSQISLHVHQVSTVLIKNPVLIGPRPKVINMFSCSTELSMKFKLLIKTKMRLKIKTSFFQAFRCCMYVANKC